MTSSPGDPAIVADIEVVVRDFRSRESGHSLFSWTLEEGVLPHLGLSERELPLGPHIVIFSVVEPMSQSRGCQVFVDQPSAQRRYFLADVAQDVVAKATSEPLPVCPLHAFQMSAVLVEERAVWRCSDHSHLECDIGTYWEWRDRS